MSYYPPQGGNYKGYKKDKKHKKDKHHHGQQAPQVLRSLSVRVIFWSSCFRTGALVACLKATLLSKAILLNKVPILPLPAILRSRYYYSSSGVYSTLTVNQKARLSSSATGILATATRYVKVVDAGQLTNFGQQVTLLSRGILLNKVILPNRAILLNKDMRRSRDIQLRR